MLLLFVINGGVRLLFSFVLGWFAGITGETGTVWGERPSWGTRLKVVVAALLAVLAVTAVQPVIVRVAAIRAIDRRELTAGRRLLESVRNAWVPV
ncbi:MAG: hypothetical protein ACK5YO_15680, partial [Planctomyces sp.]